jgi:hypothetical protein
MFQPGQTIVRRFLHPDRRLAAVGACRVVSDDERGLLLFSDLGSQVMIRTDLDGTPTRPLPLATEIAMTTMLAPRRRSAHRSLLLMPHGATHTVTWDWRPDGTFKGWYVNLETPPRRWPGGVDVHDQVLDVVIAPDRSYAWKDEADLAFLDAGAAARARAEGEKVIALAAEGAFPFDGTHLAFEPPSDWSPAELPPWWDAPEQATVSLA